MRKRAASSAIAVAILGSTFATAYADAGEKASRLDGWGGLRFGMTVDEVRAAEGYTWSELKSETTQMLGVTITLRTSMKSESQARFAGELFDLEANFEKDRHLISLSLSRKQAAGSLAECERAYGTLLVEGERQYGAFRARLATQAEERSPDKEKDYQVAEWRTVITHQSISKSTYHHQVEKWHIKSKDAWTAAIYDGAVRVLGKPYIEIGGSLEPGSSCKLTIFFAAGPFLG